MSKLANEAFHKGAPENGSSANEIVNWPESEKDLIRELAEAIRTIRYGSIVLTIHDGQLVEVSKNIRFRRNKQNEKGGSV